MKPTTITEALTAATAEATRFFSERGLSFPSSSYTVLPGFCDVHVHFREPGFSYKETIASGSRAAARGGYTSVLTMPNLSPVPDSRETLDLQLDIIRRDAVIAVTPIGAITRGERGEELSDMAAMAPDVAGFSDDGRGVQSEEMMRAAMERAHALGRPIVAHCEVNALLNGGYIHDGEYARAHGHRGISSESEYAEVERDIYLSEKTGCPLHLCHISTKESVALIRAAKARGADVTCETGPHYLVMDDGDLQEDGRYKMNPPLRAAADRLALVEGLLDGTVDMIATDHAPHSTEEKSRGLAGSAFGIVGLETAFATVYTHLVRTGTVPMERVLDALVTAPRRRFSLPLDGFSLFALDEEFTVDARDFLSKGSATPFLGRRLFGVNHLTVTSGRAVYEK
ncbi:MAG: dihydroorotase [Clostridia bacterium]|nr:dihydroorotase [Clostridia bacterium]